MNAIIVMAAGSGSRMKQAINKLYLPLRGKPILYWTLKKCMDHPLLDQIILVIGNDDQENLQGILKDVSDKPKNISWTFGAETRLASVESGLELVSPKADKVFIHDGARPFFPKELIDDLSDLLEDNVGAIPCADLVDTVKQVGKDKVIEKTLIRSELIRVFTPQAFRKRELMLAYHRLGDLTDLEKKQFTDDASVMEWAGEHVIGLDSFAYNMKITFPEDLVLAERMFDDWYERKGELSCE